MTRANTSLIVAVLASCILLATAVPVLTATTANSNRRGLRSNATAQEDVKNVTRQPANVAGYLEYPEEHQDEEERYGDGDDDKQYYGERPSGPNYYHHQEEEHPKVEAKHLCLQESSRERGSTKTSKFRCCTPDDKPGACMEPADPDYGDIRDEHEPNSGSELLHDLVSNPPATCTWKTGGNCPSWTESCFTMELNCTVTAATAECGCPFKGGFQFKARGYVAVVDAKSCEQQYNPPGPSTPRLAAANYTSGNKTYFYTGDGWIFRGKIHLIATNAGYKEAKGKVEFVTDFLDGLAVNITHGSYDDDEYYAREVDRDYGRKEEPYPPSEVHRKYRREGQRGYDKRERYYGGEVERDYTEREDQYGEREHDERQYAEHQYDEHQHEERQYEDLQFEAHQYGESLYEERQYGESQYGESQYEERQYDEGRDDGPYEAKVQGSGYGYKYASAYDRPWLKAGKLQITLYEADYS